VRVFFVVAQWRSAIGPLEGEAAGRKPVQMPRLDLLIDGEVLNPVAQIIDRDELDVRPRRIVSRNARHGRHENCHAKEIRHRSGRAMRGGCVFGAAAAIRTNMAVP